MTKIEIITRKVEKLDNELDSLESRYNRLRYRRKNQTVNIFKKYMTPSVDGLSLSRVDDVRMEFILLEDKYSSMTIERVNQEDLERLSWNDTLIDFKAYSNGLSLENVELLKKRSELQAKLAEQFEDFKDDMIAEVNTMQEKYDNFLSVISELIKTKREEAKPFRIELTDLSEKALEESLLKGIDLNKEESRYSKPSYPSVRVKFDYEVSNVKNIKVIRFSGTKKSADLELTTEYRDWEGKVYTDSRTVNRVRVDNFKYDVKRNLKLS